MTDDPSNCNYFKAGYDFRDAHHPPFNESATESPGRGYLDTVLWTAVEMTEFVKKYEPNL